MLVRAGRGCGLGPGVPVACAGKGGVSGGAVVIRGGVNVAIGSATVWACLVPLLLDALFPAKVSCCSFFLHLQHHLDVSTCEVLCAWSLLKELSQSLGTLVKTGVEGRKKEKQEKMLRNFTMCACFGRPPVVSGNPGIITSP